MTYRWQPNPAVARQLGKLEQPDREEFFRLLERLEENPRSEAARARPSPGEEDVWLAPFGRDGLLAYQILEDREPPELNPRWLLPYSGGEEGWR